MYINYEEIAKKLKFGQKFFYEMKIASNCAYIKKNVKEVKKRLKNKFPLKVVFYVYDDTKWKSQSVYDLMESDDRFEPYIFVTKNNAPKDNCNYQTNEEYEKVYDFFAKKNMRVIRGYDTESDRFIPLEETGADIIIYQHPWYVETTQGPVVCSKFALTYYIPYFVSDTDESFEYDLRFHKYVHRYYVPNEIIKNNYASKMPDRGEKLAVVGHPLFDYYYLDKKPHEEKYIIYAPHWTVCGDNIRYGTFDWSGYRILEYAESRPELNWVFKPHPLLYKFLFTSGYMSKKQADEYYKRWEKVGILYDKGDYTDIFQNSRLMITDSGSFLIEYFVTQKPCIHLLSEKFKGNNFVQQICKTYYEAKNINEFNEYLDILINRGQDPKKPEREEVLAKLNLTGTYCAKNILEDIIKDIG